MAGPLGVDVWVEDGGIASVFVAFGRFVLVGTTVLVATAGVGLLAPITTGVGV